MLYCLALNKKKVGFDSTFESSLFADSSKALQAIEKRLKIKSHFELFSYAAQNDLCPPGMKETKVPWFEPDEGISWLEAIIAFLRAIPDSVERSEELAVELAECRDILMRARTAAAKWHFEMDT